MKRISSYPIVVAIAILASTTNTTHAGTPFFYDDFDRESLWDSELNWSEEFSRGELSLENGSLLIQPNDDSRNSNAIVLTSDPVGDFIVRTQVSFDEASIQGINPWVGIWGRALDDGETAGFWGGPATDGNVYVGTTSGGVNTIRDSQLVFDYPEVKESDIHVEYAAIGDDVAITAWYVGTEKPERPHVRLRQTRFDTGEIFGITFNPTGALEQMSIRHFAVLPAVPGDFSASDSLDTEDIDLLSEELRDSPSNRAYDLNNDAHVSPADRRFLIEDVLNTYLGDSNLDGEFNSGDLVAVFTVGAYEDAIPLNSGWADGDWDGDGDFDSGDFVVAFTDGGYEQGPRVAVNAVPEPSTIVLMMIGVIGLAIRRRHDVA